MGPASEPRPASSAPATQRRPISRSKANSRRPLCLRARAFLAWRESFFAEGPLGRVVSAAALLDSATVRR